MYACPNCSQSVISFWRKSRASDAKPYSCPACGKALALPASLHVLAALVGPAFLVACAYISGLYFRLRPWPVVVGALVAITSLVITVHRTSLNIATIRRTRTAKVLWWAMIVGL